MSKNVPNPFEEISEADCAQTPESVKQLVRSLQGRIEQLERKYEELKAENAGKREQTQRNSKNSSKPPSQDVSKGFKSKEKKALVEAARGAIWT